MIEFINIKFLLKKDNVSMKRLRLYLAFTVLIMVLLACPAQSFADPHNEIAVVAEEPENAAETLTQSAVELSNVQAGIRVKWTKVAQAERYKIYKKSGKGSYKLLRMVKSGEKRCFVDKNVKDGKSYSYMVKAVSSKAFCESKVSHILRLTSPAIRLEKKKGQVNVSWKKVAGAKSYVIYRKSGKGKWRKIKTVKVTDYRKSSYKYSDKSVRCKRSYCYAVQVKNKRSESAYKYNKKKVTLGAHKYGKARTVAVSCKGKGYKVKRCSICGYRYRYHYTKNVLPHVWKNQKKNGGWVKVGKNKMKRTCKNCGQVAKRPIKTGSVILDYGVQFVGGKFRLHADNLTMTSDCEIDCSHFVYNVLKNTGIHDTGYHYAREWKRYGKAVNLEDAKPGDVIVLDGHCAFYMGGGTVLHASRQLAYPDGGIRITDFGDSIYDALDFFENTRKQKFLGLRRFE